jgi:hypothetical protein
MGIIVSNVEGNGSCSFCQPGDSQTLMKMSCKAQSKAIERTLNFPSSDFPAPVFGERSELDS